MLVEPAWRLVRRISTLSIFGPRRLIAEVPRGRNSAEADAAAIASLPALFWTARAIADSTVGDAVPEEALGRAIALLAPLRDFEPTAWRARGRSVWAYGRRPLVAHACDCDTAAAISATPPLVQAVRLLAASAEAEAFRVVGPAAIRCLTAASWEPKLVRTFSISAPLAPRRTLVAGAVPE